MADYRVISQDYARGAIKALTVINGGAALAALSQLVSLTELGLGFAVGVAFFIWIVGVTTATFIWLLAFASTRHVDRSEDQNCPNPQNEIDISNRYMLWVVRFAVISRLCFIVGSAFLILPYVLSFNASFCVKWIVAGNICYFPISDIKDSF